jgi:hypothetical protein
MKRPKVIWGRGAEGNMLSGKLPSDSNIEESVKICQTRKGSYQAEGTEHSTTSPIAGCFLTVGELSQEDTLWGA